MRFFQTFPEAFNEIRRDLAEMGTEIHTQTMQDKFIAQDEGFATMELQNYVYTVLDPNFSELNPVQPWADAEWNERLAGIKCNPPVNPGTAWQLRSDVWGEFLHNGHFEYYYPLRLSMKGQILNIIQRLREDPASRQLYAAMWVPNDSTKLGQVRVPCSLGWHFMMRNGALNITYFMRSCDFGTHYQNDIFLSLKMLEYVAQRAEVPMGYFTHFISSLHVYKKDVQNVF